MDYNKNNKYLSIQIIKIILQFSEKKIQIHVPQIVTYCVQNKALKTQVVGTYVFVRSLLEIFQLLVSKSVLI